MSAELAIAIIGAVIPVGGLFITAGVMLKSNKQGFEMIDLKISNLTAMLALERDGMKKDISDIEGEVHGVKLQLKDEIYPRLNANERDIQKNCRSIIDHKELCNIKHKIQGGGNGTGHNLIQHD
jgi:hypothetical protein